MIIQPQDTELKPCFAFFSEGETEASKLYTMIDKVQEEVDELRAAIVAYLVEAPKSGTAHGKARERVLEEGVDAQIALQTLMRVLASTREIEQEVIKDNLKNGLRGYHGEAPEDD